LIFWLLLLEVEELISYLFSTPLLELDDL
jgi:hypothetical protein